MAAYSNAPDGMRKSTGQMMDDRKAANTKKLMGQIKGLDKAIYGGYSDQAFDAATRSPEMGMAVDGVKPTNFSGLSADRNRVRKMKLTAINRSRRENVAKQKALKAQLPGMNF